MTNLYQPALWNEQPLSQYTIFPAIERLLGHPMTDEMKIKYRTCHTIESLFTFICHDHFTQALLMGDQGIGALTEMYMALRSGTKWQPMDGLDTWGAKLDGLEVAGIRLQVRHSKNYKSNTWNFRTRDSTSSRRYDILACVGYPVPKDFTGMTVNFLNPLSAEVFLIPVAKLGEKEQINISRQEYRLNSVGRRLDWWEYNIADHANIDETVTRMAHGKSIKLDSQMRMFDGFAD